MDVGHVFIDSSLFIDSCLYPNTPKVPPKGFFQGTCPQLLPFFLAPGIMFFIMAGGFYIASLLIKDGSSDFKRFLAQLTGDLSNYKGPNPPGHVSWPPHLILKGSGVAFWGGYKATLRLPWTLDDWAWFFRPYSATTKCS